VSNISGGQQCIKKQWVCWRPYFFLICTICPGEAADKTSQQLVQEAKATIKEVSINDVQKMLNAKKKFILLDVRDAHEFAGGHIHGAINISRGTLEFQAALAMPDKNASIIVYCGTDRRSPLATRTLNDLGYTNAVNMVGGLEVWQAAGYPSIK
jgi:rhodanese-related sulfurtransferase